MYRASCFNVQINQRDATLLMNDLYYPLIGSTCFGLSPVHHQEHHLLNRITHWYVRAIRRVYSHTTARRMVPAYTGIYQMRCTAYKVAPDDGLIQSETCRASNGK